MSDVLQELATALERSGVPEEVLRKSLSRTADPTKGDFTLTCFPLAKLWGAPPPECAKRVAASLALPPALTRCEVAGPYLNFFLDRTAHLGTIVSSILESGHAVGSAPGNGHTIVIDYSSPNIAKPFHVGHLRTTIIGHSLVKVLRHRGYNVVGVNHLGDWGTQFGFVWAGCKLWGDPGENASIEDLVDRYRSATILRKQQETNEVPLPDHDKPDVNKMAREYFIALEAGKEEEVDFWQRCVDISLVYLKRIYARLGVEFEFYHGESFYTDKLPAIEKWLRESGTLEESRGALGMQFDDPIGFVRIFAEDGRSLYITRDIAAADYRERTFGAKELVYVVGAPQSLHFQQLKAVLKRLGHPAADKIRHVPYGHVPGIATRGRTADSGRLYLSELLDDAHEHARAAYDAASSNRPADVDPEIVAEAVGLGAIFFDYLSRSNTKDFHFKWDQALNFQGDTGPYIQYMLARIHSIEAKALESGIQLDDGEPFDPALLTEPGAYDLAVRLEKFGEFLAKIEADYEPYHLTNYLLDTAKSFSAIYRELRVVGEDPALARARLALFRATRYVLHVGLTLLGVPPLQRM